MTKRRYPPRPAPPVEEGPRPAVRWANYPVQAPRVGEILGPTDLGKNDYMVVVESNDTRAGFAVARPADRMVAPMYGVTETAFGKAVREVVR